MYFYIIFSVFSVFLVECSLPTDLSAYLTQNKSHYWLLNQTENSNSPNPYCSICCMDTSGRKPVGKKCGKHTMCIYDDKKSGPNCKGFIPIRFTEEEITVIVDIHNTIRSKIALGEEYRGNPGPQPSASNMRMIEWDAELALLAHRWAAQCIFAHDVCRDVSRYPVGQNIARGNFALNNDLSFVVNWYDTVEMFGPHEISNYEIVDDNKYPSPSEYTQLIWAETYQVGCARVAFQRTNGPNVTYREHFICNYGPSGNIPGQRIYKIGEPCTECPDGTGCSIEYPGLCGNEAVHDMSYRGRAKKAHDPNGSEKADFSLLVGSLYLLVVFLFFLSE